MPTTPTQRKLTSLWHQLSPAEYNPNALYTVLQNEGRTTGLQPTHLAPALGAVIESHTDWEHLWAFLGPQPLLGNIYRCELVWHQVDWDDTTDGWAPTTGSDNEMFWDFVKGRPTGLPRVTREDALAGESEDLGSVGRTIIGVHREEVPDVVSALVGQFSDRLAEPRIWMEPDDVGEKYNLTFDVLVWREDPPGTDEPRWVPIDEIIA